MKWSWHKEYYDKSMRTIINTAGKKYAAFSEQYGEQDTGWMVYFRNNHPDLYRKYAEAMHKINMLWGDVDPVLMESWKAAVKVEVDATQWAIDKYIEHQTKLARGEAQPTLQEAAA